MKAAIASALTAGLLMSTVPAHAGSLQNSTEKSVQVSTSGIDLATPEGQRELDQRIRIAARKACDAPDRTIGSRLMPRSVRDCITQAKLKAHKQVTAMMEERARGG